MKSTLIVVLLLALLGATYYTRPSQDDFKRYITAQQASGDTNVLKAGWDQMQADQFAKNCTFADRLLWVDVKNQNGQTVYTGALGHWFSRAQIAADVNNAKQKIGNVKIDSK